MAAGDAYHRIRTRSRCIASHTWVVWVVGWVYVVFYTLCVVLCCIFYFNAHTSFYNSNSIIVCPRCISIFYNIHTFTTYTHKTFKLFCDHVRTGIYGVQKVYSSIFSWIVYKCVPAFAFDIAVSRSNFVRDVPGLI